MMARVASSKGNPELRDFLEGTTPALLASFQFVTIYGIPLRTAKLVAVEQPGSPGSAAAPHLLSGVPRNCSISPNGLAHCRWR
jgi:hypothetical protein